MAFLAWSILILCLGCVYGGSSERHQVLRAVPRDDDQLQMLQRLQDNKFEVDFWKEPGVIGEPVDFMVSSDIGEKLQKLLESHSTTGLEVSIMIDDVEELIQDQTKSRHGGKNIDHTSYHTLAEIEEWLFEKAESSDIAELIPVATSYEGRSIYTLKISTGSEPDKKAIWIDGGIHAREWVSPATMIYFIDHFLTNYGSDTTITALVDAFDWYIMPVFNVDGYQYTWTGERLWRKTRSPNAGSSCVGCDPNRNWDFHWGEVGVSPNPCTETFPGSEPFSEQESREVAAYVAAIPNIQSYIAYHSYGQMYMLPYGYTSARVPDHDELMVLCRRAVAALQGVHGFTYRCESLINLVGPNSGGSVDYTYGAANIKYSLAVELRDTGFYGFLLPPAQIIPNSEENLAALIEIAQHILDNTPA